MLVIISDLHLCDGSTGETVSPGAFQFFAQRVRELAVAASWRTDNHYRPIDRVDIVLLGDAFDLLRSARWASRPNIRPWGNPHAPELLDRIAQITADIITNNQQSLDVLHGLAAEGGLTVPPALKSAQPATDAPGQPVPVRIHCMVGNHDWFYHLPGPGYDAVRQTLATSLGLANRHDRPFPHDITESDELLQAMRRHKVSARHGDLFDPLNFEGDRDSSSLGDAIVIELVNRFSAEVEAGLGSELPAATALGLREIDHLRPLLLIPVWIDGLLERTCPSPAVRKRVKTVWDRLVDEFLALDFVRQHDTWSPLDLVDGLRRALKFSKRLSLGWTSSIVEWLQRVRGSKSDSYYPHALAEQDFRNRRARSIVYGHSHTAESVPLDASYAEGYVLNQVYFNSGTWRRVHSPTRLAPAEHEFIAADVMTYLAFFQGDERKGRPYETWSGMLGHTANEVSIHRIDAGRGSPVAAQAAAALRRSQPAPHFTALTAKPAAQPPRRA